MPQINVEEQSTLVRVTQSNGLPINSGVEALDREIKQLKTEFVGDNWRTGKFQGWFDSSELAKVNFIQDDSLPKNTVLITDCTGVAWGPLICDPMCKPKEWPFKGRLGNIKIKPVGRRGIGLGTEHDWLVELEPLSIIVDQGQLWLFIETLNSEGWLSTIRAFFKEDLKLVKNFHVAPRGEDEEEDP